MVPIGGGSPKSVIDGQCTLKLESGCDTGRTFYMTQAVHIQAIQLII